MPILIEKNWRKNLLLSLENEVYFFLEGKSNFFRPSLDRDYRNDFLNFVQKIQDFSFHTFWNKTIGPRHTPAQCYRLAPIKPPYNPNPWASRTHSILTFFDSPSLFGFLEEEEVNCNYESLPYVYFEKASIIPTPGPTSTYRSPDLFL